MYIVWLSTRFPNARAILVLPLPGGPYRNTEVPEFNDEENRLQWRFRASRAQGTVDDEVAVVLDAVQGVCRQDVDLRQGPFAEQFHGLGGGQVLLEETLLGGVGRAGSRSSRSTAVCTPPGACAWPGPPFSLPLLSCAIYTAYRPPSPSSLPTCTVCGNAATSSAAPFCLPGLKISKKFPSFPVPTYSLRALHGKIFY